MKLLPLLLLPLLALPGCAAPRPTPHWTPETQIRTNKPLLPPPPVVLRSPVLRLETQATQAKPRLTLNKSEETNQLGNPLWVLTLEAPGEAPFQLRAVSGRAYAQNRDRNKSGTRAPLPPGVYSIGQAHQGPFSLKEIGGLYFVELIPRFATSRTDLGIHWDPSFEKDKKEDGTDGCVALTNPDDLQTVIQFLRRTGATTLTVTN